MDLYKIITLQNINICIIKVNCWRVAVGAEVVAKREEVQKALQETKVIEATSAKDLEEEKASSPAL